MGPVIADGQTGSDKTPGSHRLAYGRVRMSPCLSENHMRGVWPIQSGRRIGQRRNARSRQRLRRTTRRSVGPSAEASQPMPSSESGIGGFSTPPSCGLSSAATSMACRQPRTKPVARRDPIALEPVPRMSHRKHDPGRFRCLRNCLTISDSAPLACRTSPIIQLIASNLP